MSVTSPMSASSSSTKQSEHVTLCRFCGAFCPIRVTVEDGRATRVIGVKENELYAGYTCVKGRALPEQHIQGLQAQQL